MKEFLSLVMAPLLVGLTLLLVEHWLDDYSIAKSCRTDSHAYFAIGE